MYLLSLLCCSCLTCSYSPDWLVGYHDILKLLSVEVEHTLFQFFLHHGVLLVSLALLE